LNAKGERVRIADLPQALQDKMIEGLQANMVAAAKAQLQPLSEGNPIQQALVAQMLEEVAQEAQQARATGTAVVTQ
jgi:hypothetical protein